MSLHSETRGIRMSLTSRRMWWPEPCHHFVMCPPQNTVASFCLSGESPLCSPGWPGMCLSFPRMEITSHVPPCLLSATEGIESWTLCTLGSTLPTNLNVLAQREPLTDGEWQEAKLKSLHGRRYLASVCCFTEEATDGCAAGLRSTCSRKLGPIPWLLWPEDLLCLKQQMLFKKTKKNKQT